MYDLLVNAFLTLNEPLKKIHFDLEFLCINNIVIVFKSNSFVTPWTVDHQAPLFMGFPRQEYWHGLPFLPPGHLHDPGIDKCNMLESSQTHLHTLVRGRTVFHETGVWCPERWKPLPLMTSQCLRTGVTALGYECVSG